MNDLQNSSAYADFIMAHCDCDRIICNGDTLLQAMEDGYLYENFLCDLADYTF